MTTKVSITELIIIPTEEEENVSSRRVEWRRKKEGEINEPIFGRCRSSVKRESERARQRESERREREERARETERDLEKRVELSALECVSSSPSKPSLT